MQGLSRVSLSLWRNHRLMRFRYEMHLIWLNQASYNLKKLILLTIFMIYWTSLLLLSPIMTFLITFLRKIDCQKKHHKISITLKIFRVQTNEVKVWYFLPGKMSLRSVTATVLRPIIPVIQSQVVSSRNSYSVISSQFLWRGIWREQIPRSAWM